MTFIANTVAVEGGENKTDSTDATTHRLLVDILRELKIMNLHLSKMTDTYINSEDVHV
jgi:hypothetical protein